MKNSFYIRTLKLFLVSGLSLLAFHSYANAQTHNEEEFKVELKPNSTATKTSTTSSAKAEAKAAADTKTRVEISPEEEHPVVKDVKKVVAENIPAATPAPVTPEAKPTPALPPPPQPAAEPIAKKSLQYHRDIQIVDGQAVYIVNGRAPHLYMVSRDLYGSERMWKQIADWNSLKAPYDLSPGQRLVLKKAPTISGAEADKILLKNWAQMDRWDIIKGIILAQQSQPHYEEVEAAPPAAAVGVIAPVTHEEEASPAAEEKPAPLHTAPAAHGHEGHWKFKTAAVVSYFTLKNDNTNVPVNNTFHSEIDYGIELEAAYHFNERTELLLGASVEKMDIAHPEDDSEIEGHAQYLARYSLGVESKFNPRVIFAGYAAYEQTPFAIPTTDGAEIVAIYVPQISVGFRWGLIERGGFSTWLVTDGIYALKAKKDDIDLKNGGGYQLGFRFANEFDKRTLTYGVLYRELKQDSDTARNTLQTYYGNIGLIW